MDGFMDLTLSRAQADRNASLRGKIPVLRELRANADARFVLIHSDDVAVDGGALLKVRQADLPVLATTPASYLGRDQGIHYFGVDLSRLMHAGDWRDVLEGHTFENLRSAAFHFNELDSGLSTTAVGLFNWQRTSRYCSICGTEAWLLDSGWEQKCQQGHSIFPRIDPCVIMAIRDSSDRLLLGKNAHWPDGHYSTLAGFVESGEPLESAVRREVMEEAGVEVGPVEYVGSQPWPFPRSLMAAFRGWTVADFPTVTVDEKEISEAFFISREELDEALATGRMALPGASSVARALIEDWYGGPIGERKSGW